MNNPLWLENLISLGYGHDKALETFYLTTDKEIAAKMAYKAMGLDPKDAPTFGWNQPSARPQLSARPQQAIPVAVPQNNIILICFIVFLCVTLILGAIYMVMQLARPGQTVEMPNLQMPNMPMPNMPMPTAPRSGQNALAEEICKTLDKYPDLQVEVKKRVFEILKMIKERQDGPEVKKSP